MPAIPDYFAPGAASQIRPSETGEQTLLRAGAMGERRAAIAADMRQRGEDTIIKGAERLGDAAVQGGVDIAKIGLQHAELADTTNTVKNSSALTLTTHKDLNDLTAGGDPAAFQKYYDTTWKQNLDKFVNDPSVVTEEGRKQRISEGAMMDRDMQHQTLSAASLTAATKVVTDADTAVQTLAQAVSTNLGALPEAKRQIDTLFDAAVKGGNMTPEAVAHLREQQVAHQQQLDLSGFRSALAANPQHAAALVSQGFFKNLPPGVDVAGAVKEAQRQAEGDALRGIALQEHALDQASRKAYKGWFQDNMGADGLPGPNAGKALIANEGNMQPAQLDQAAGLLRVGNETAQREKDRVAKGLDLVSNPAVKTDFLTHMTDDVGSPTFPTPLKIGLARAAGDLNPEDAQFLTQLSHEAATDPQVAAALRRLSEDNPQMKSLFDGAEQQLTAASFRINSAAATGVGGFGQNQAVRFKFDQFKADTQRILQTAALNRQDMTPLLDPTSKQYLFSQDRVNQYRPTKQEIQNRLVAPVAAGVVPGVTPTEKPAEKPPLEDVLRKALSFPVKPDNRPPPT